MDSTTRKLSNILPVGVLLTALSEISLKDLEKALEDHFHIVQTSPVFKVVTIPDSVYSNNDTIER